MTVRISILGGEGGAAERAGDQLTAAGFLLAPLAEGEVILQMLPLARDVVEALAREDARPLRARCYLDFAALRLDRITGGVPVVEVDWRVLSPTVSMLTAGGGSSASELALPVLRALGEVDYDADGLSRRKFVASQFESFKSWVTERITLEELWGGSHERSRPFPSRPPDGRERRREAEAAKRVKSERLHAIENHLSFPLRGWAKAHSEAYTSLNQPRFEAKLLESDEIWRFDSRAAAGVLLLHAGEVIEGNIDVQRNIAIDWKEGIR